MPELDISKPLTPELEGEGDLGTVIEKKGFVVRVGDAAVCHRLTSVFGHFGLDLKKYAQLHERFEVWLVPHTVSLVRRHGLSEPVSVGLVVDYEDDGSTCCVVALIPTPQFVEHGRLGFNFKGLASGSGELAGLPGHDSPASGEELGGGPLAVGGLKLSINAGASIGLMMTCQVATPTIMAVGAGTRSCEWRFDRHEEPLFGKDIETWSILVLPKRKSKLRYRIKCYVVLRTLLLPTRLESEWMDVPCLLK